MTQYLHVCMMNHFQRQVCSRRKTNTYNYHKRKWNKKVTSNSKTGTKQIFTILSDELVAMIYSEFITIRSRRNLQRIWHVNTYPFIFKSWLEKSSKGYPFKVPLLPDSISIVVMPELVFAFFQSINLLFNDLDKQKIVMLSVKIDKQCSRVGTLTCLIGVESKIL